MKKTKILVFLTPVVVLIVATALMIALSIETFNYGETFGNYVYSIFNFGFIIFAIGTYAYIFYQFKTRQHKPTIRKKATASSNTNDAGKQKKSSKSSTVCCKSKFYIAFLLILSFLLLMVIPSLYYLFSNEESFSQDFLP